MAVIDRSGENDPKRPSESYQVFALFRKHTKNRTEISHLRANLDISGLVYSSLDCSSLVF